MTKDLERKTDSHIEELPAGSLPSYLLDLEEANHRLEQDLNQQHLIVSRLTQSVRELEARNLELVACRDQALAELGQWNQTESFLRKKSEALARSNYDLEQFASLAAHDLQEPLHSIQAFIDVLRVKYGPSLDGQGMGYLDRVTKAANRMQKLIEGLLLYCRIDAYEKKGNSLSLGEITREVLSDLGAQIDKVQAEIHVGDLPVIIGHALPIRQLLQNLLTNALKFHKPGVPPVIQITGMIIPDRRHRGSGLPDQLCQINIQDNGIGIPAQHLDNIFGMFKRLHRKEEFEGTGIGLAVCQRIVDQWGGAISVRSTMDEGSTFTVTLPTSLP